MHAYSEKDLIAFNDKVLHLLEVRNLKLKDASAVQEVLGHLMTVNEGSLDACLNDIQEIFQWEADGDWYVENNVLDLRTAFYAYVEDNFVSYFRDYCSGKNPPQYVPVIETAKQYLAAHAL